MKKTEKYYNFNTKKKRFSQWLAWLIYKQKPKRLNQQKAHYFRRYMLFQAGMKILKVYHNMAQKTMQVIHYRMKKHSHQLKRKIFYAWNENYSSLCKRNHRLESLKKNYILHRLTNAWKNTYYLSRLMKSTIKQAEEIHKRLLKGKVLRALKIIQNKKERIILMKEAVMARCNHKKLKHFLELWEQAFKSSQNKKRQERNIKMSVESKYFKAWTSYTRFTSMKKWKNKNLHRNLIIKRKNFLSNIVDKWHNYARWKKRSQNVKLY